MPGTKDKIVFGKKYSKLGKQLITTVRWLDSIYRLGKVYPVYIIAQNMFHAKYEQGDYQLIKLELKQLKDLSDEFIRQDADCSREEFMEMMEHWYSKKKDWKGEDSEVQVLTLWKQVESNGTTKQRSLL